MSTAGYIVNVPKLKGRENYEDWSFTVKNFLVLEGIDMDAILPTITEAEQRKAKAKLIMTIDPSLYVHIKNETTITSVWNKLKQLFDDTGFSRRISLLRTLINIRLDNCETMTSYVSQIVETAQRLKNTGFEISDEWVGSLLLAGLPDKFSPMVMALEHSGLSASSDVIKTKLLDMSFDVGSSGGESALWSGKPKVGSTAHVKSKQMSMSSSNTKGTTCKQIKCYNCKKIGHYKNQCPNKIKAGAFSVAFLNRNFSIDDWYIDSGASVHMTAKRESLLEIRPVQDIKEIVVANKSSMPVMCTGDTQIVTCVNESQFDIPVRNILCIPNLTTNLLSVSKLIANGNKVLFGENACYIRNQQNVLIGVADLQNGVYKLNTVRSEKVLAAATIHTVDARRWHRRLAHINSIDLEKMKNGAVKGITYTEKADITKSNCEVCCEAKQARLPFSSSHRRSETLL